jgi:hypothetical protein
MRLKSTRSELRATLFVLLGIAVTILLIMAGGAFWKREYSLGSMFLAVGVMLAYAFFRKRKAFLFMIGLIWVAVNAGLTGVFHPTALGILITIGLGWHSLACPVDGRKTANFSRLMGGDIKPFSNIAKIRFMLMGAALVISCPE